MTSHNVTKFVQKGASGMNNHIKVFTSKWALLVLAILVVLAGFIISNRGVTARPQEDGTLVLAVENEHTGVSYLIGVDNLANEVNGRIEYDSSTVTGIEQYRAFNNQELAKILQDVDSMAGIPTKITFNSPLSQEELTEFVQQYEIEVESYLIYMLEPDGKIATIQGGPSDGELVPTTFFNAATGSISQEYSPGAEFLGWVEVSGTVQASRVSELNKDPHVFLVDIMRLFLETKLTDEALAAAGIPGATRRNFLQNGYAEIQQRPLAADLYHLGLMKLDTQEQ